jgi:hypothetical protein
MPPPTIDDLMKQIDALTSRVRTLESRVLNQPDWKGMTTQLQRLADLTERKLAAQNQLGTLVARAEQFQSTLTAPKFPWKPT